MKKVDWCDDNERDIQFYTGLADHYGVDVRSLDWGSRASQHLRFAVLAQLPLASASVLDVGCGLGDFWAWLAEKSLPVSYAGLDITPRMIEIARQRFPGVRFQTGDILDDFFGAEKFDYVVASGIFAKRQTQPFEFLKAMATKMFSLAHHGVGFNCLSSWAEQQEAGEFYADPLELLAFARTLTPSVALHHNYHPRDFTVFLYKAACR